jgi:hypothetical protein
MADETRIDPDGAIRIFNVLTEIGEDIDVALSKVTDIRARLGEDESLDPQSVA